MKIHYLKLGDLNEDELQQVWCVLKDIRGTLNIRYANKPIKSILVSLNQKNYNISISPAKVHEILSEFQRKGILKILQANKFAKNLNAISVKINQRKFDSEYKEVKERVENLNLGKPRKETKTNLLITRDSNGDFYFRNKLCNFQNDEDIYYKVFVVVFERSDPNGFCSYSEIDKFLIQNGEDKLEDLDKIRKRITNAIPNLFRFTKNLPNKAPNGRPILSVKRGKGLIFYNPQI